MIRRSLHLGNSPEEQMNLAHLGDALDHWKGSLIELIGGKNVRVVPMFTDDKPWTEQQIEAYARLLRIRPEAVLKRDGCFSGKTRTSYFAISEIMTYSWTPILALRLTTKTPRRNTSAPPRSLVCFQRHRQGCF